MANPRIYVLDGLNNGNDAASAFVMWLVAPSARTIPNPNVKSSVQGLAALPASAFGPTGVTGAQILAQLQAGTLVEQLGQPLQVSRFQSDGVTPLTQAQEAAAFEVLAASQWTAAQAALTATALLFHAPGAVWDGTTWTAGP